MKTEISQGENTRQRVTVRPGLDVPQMILWATPPMHGRGWTRETDLDNPQLSPALRKHILGTRRACPCSKVRRFLEFAPRVAVGENCVSPAPSI